MLLLPAIDLLNGRCVRLMRGDYAQATTYAADPVDVAKGFESEGATWLHLVDLDGAKAGAPRHLDAVRRIAAATSLNIEFGGGIRSVELARAALDFGATRVVVGTRLTEDEATARLFFETLGDAVVAGIDARDGIVATHGWTQGAGVGAIGFARRMAELGCKRVAFTDVATDGALQGPNLAATRAMVDALTIPIVASGGVAALADLDALAGTGAEAAIVGRALYEGRFTVAEALARL